MPNRPTLFQLRAKGQVDAFAATRGLSLRWTEEPGELYVGELMIVGRADDEALTLWIYDDAVDYRFQRSETVNFEAQSYPSEAALLAAMLEDLGQRAPPHAPSGA